MRNFLFILSLITGVIVNAQNKIDYSGMAFDSNSDSEYAVIIEFNDPNADIRGYDVEVMTRIYDMIIALVPARQIEKIAALPEVKRLKLSVEVDKLGEKSNTEKPMSTTQKSGVLLPVVIDEDGAKLHCCSETQSKTDKCSRSCCKKECPTEEKKNSIKKKNHPKPHKKNKRKRK